MTRDRAQHHLKAVRREAERVARLEPEWSSESFLADDRIAVRAEWANVMDRFSLVVRFHEADGLDRHLVEDLVDVAQLLARLCPMLERMQLRRPSPAELARLGVPSAA